MRVRRKEVLDFIVSLKSNHVAGRKYLDLVKFQLARRTAVDHAAAVDQNEARVAGKSCREKLLEACDHLEQMTYGRGVPDKAQGPRVSALQQVRGCGKPREREHRRRADEGLAGVCVDPGDAFPAAADNAGQVQAEGRLARAWRADEHDRPALGGDLIRGQA